MIRFVRQSFGCSSEVLRKKYRFPEADPKVIRRRPEESTPETGQNASKSVKTGHSFHKSSTTCGFIKG
ncbi:hypothetical protein [Chryseobacterium sp. POE27]|uniref:hypothetical protein n=1 Tax=Chryseobacterium sp. POE27 TaxID=3138177 RepID=UPI003219F88C